jgi:hypothetical protein
LLALEHERAAACRSFPLREQGSRIAALLGRVIRSTARGGQWLDSAADAARNRLHPFLNAGLGNVDDAISWRECASDGKSVFMAGVNITPAFDAIRTDPRFRSLMRRTGLQPAEPNIRKEGISNSVLLLSLIVSRILNLSTPAPVRIQTACTSGRMYRPVRRRWPRPTATARAPALRSTACSPCASRRDSRHGVRMPMSSIEAGRLLAPDGRRRRNRVRGAALRAGGPGEVRTIAQCTAILDE